MKAFVDFCISGLLWCVILRAVCPSTVFHHLLVFDAHALKRIASYAWEDFTDHVKETNPEVILLNVLLVAMIGACFLMIMIIWKNE